MSEEHRYQHQCNADLATRAMLRQEGRELEQERIIKLLEAEVDVVREFAYAIALIKGENNAR